MDKPTLVADVRSFLRRSLPDTIQGNDALPLDSSQDNHETVQTGLDDIAMFGLNRTKDLTKMLQMASVLSRLLPGVHLVLMNTPTADLVDNNAATPILAGGRHADRVVSVRAALAAAFPNVPAAAEALLSELGVIERQDRLYYCNCDQDRDATTAWAYQQRRREDILDEISELKRWSILGSISASD
jgi:hypothetical protein